MVELSPETVLTAYATGIFPMAESAEDSTVYWVDPERRGIIPLDRIHVSRRLARTVRSDRFDVLIDTDFEEVIAGCAEATRTRPATWINESIAQLYRTLFERGAVHTVECWRDGRLVGGLYGVSLAGAFYGESMFTRERDASKVALVHLFARLIAGGYVLLDTQFVTEHLKTFGAIEISRADYHRQLDRALKTHGDFFALPAQLSGADALQSITQTS